jgi:hypothetical protein
MTHPIPIAPRGALAAWALSALAFAQGPTPATLDSESAGAAASLVANPRAWLPADELLCFKIEVTLGPVRSLDVGSVRLRSAVEPPLLAAAVPASSGADEDGQLIGSLESLAKGSYLGHEVVHSYRTRWYAGDQPRIELVEKLRGSRTRTRELSFGPSDEGWQLAYRRDGHCKGCDDDDHVVEGGLLWGEDHHCDDCERPDHHVWRDYEYIPIPADAVDIVSALYLARSFLKSEQAESSLHLVNKDELWTVRLRRGERRRIETDAGEFDCVRVLLGPEQVGGDELGEEGKARFEALFGLHGDISLWVDRRGAFPVVIEGTVPLGPFDVAIKASLTRREGG